MDPQMAEAVQVLFYAAMQSHAKCKHICYLILEEMAHRYLSLGAWLYSWSFPSSSYSSLSRGWHQKWFCLWWIFELLSFVLHLFNEFKWIHIIFIYILTRSKYTAAIFRLSSIALRGIPNKKGRLRKSMHLRLHCTQMKFMIQGKNNL